MRQFACLVLLALVWAEDYGSYDYDTDSSAGLREADGGEDGEYYVDEYGEDSDDNDDEYGEYDEDYEEDEFSMNIDNVVFEGTVWYDEDVTPKESFGGILSMLLETQTEASEFRGVDDTLTIDEYQGMILRRINKRKNKKNKKRPPKKKNPNLVNRDSINFKMGGISAFKYGVVSNIQYIQPTNCRRGWHADKKICANSCRVTWLKGNPRERYDEDEEAFYSKNKEFTKCEACALWSGLVNPNTAGFFQKTLSHMRKGAPTFCDVENDPECNEKEMEFSACMGPDVCAEACWSKVATNEKCLRCKSDWCDTHPRATLHRDYYGICLLFDKCYKKYNPSRYSKTNTRGLNQGMDCWGKPFNDEVGTDLGKFNGMSESEYCNQVNGPYNKPYPNWIKFYKECHSQTCVEGGLKYNVGACKVLECQKTCLNEDFSSQECIDCMWPKGSPCGGECVRAKQKLLCRTQCNKFSAMRLAHADLHSDEFRNALAHCQSKLCFGVFQKGCKVCIGRAENQGERVYDTALGTNNFRQNFNGWGCPIMCEGRNIVTIANNDYKKVKPDRQTAFRNMAMGALDEKTIAGLIEFAHAKDSPY